MKNIVIFDLETTGLDVNKGAKIVEICAIKLSPELQEIGRIDTLINPEVPIPDFITKINGIDDSMVKDSPTFDKILDEFLLLSEDSVLMAYNAPFDISFVKYFAAQKNKTVTHPVVDLLAISHDHVKYLPNYKLESVRKAIGVPELTMHRAYADVYVCIELWKKWIPNHSMERAFELTRNYKRW